MSPLNVLKHRITWVGFAALALMATPTVAAAAPQQQGMFEGDDLDEPLDDDMVEGDEETMEEIRRRARDAEDELDNGGRRPNRAEGRRGDRDRGEGRRGQDRRSDRDEALPEEGAWGDSGERQPPRAEDVADLDDSHREEARRGRRAARDAERRAADAEASADYAERRADAAAADADYAERRAAEAEADARRAERRADRAAAAAAAAVVVGVGLHVAHRHHRRDRGRYRRHHRRPPRVYRPRRPAKRVYRPRSRPHRYRPDHRRGHRRGHRRRR